MSQTILGVPLLAWIPLLPLLGALFNLTLGRKLSARTIHTVAIGAVALSFLVTAFSVFGPLWSAYKAYRAGAGGAPDLRQLVYTWIEVGSFKVDLAFRLDTLSAVMVLIVTFVGTLIHIYSAGYMHGDRRYAAYFGYLNLFTGSMLILVLAANLPVMFIGWEGVGLCSYLLIGFWFEDPKSTPRPGKQGLHHQPRGRRRLPARHVPALLGGHGLGTAGPRSTSPI